MKTSVKILKDNANKKVYSSRKISVREIDNFLLSGKFNSVLGLDGFSKFKKVLKDVIAKINSNDFSSNIINLDKMFEALLGSGIYYEDEHLPEDFKNTREDHRWLTAYRYLAKNFLEMSYKDFREIIKRFEETRGYSFYIDESDNEYLKSILKKQMLFIEVQDVKADLLQLSQTELREICKVLEIQSARSMIETVERISLCNEEDIKKLIPAKTKKRTNLIIKDDELATGHDLINLDKYLRELSKIMREDLSGYVTERRYISFLKD